MPEPCRRESVTGPGGVIFGGERGGILRRLPAGEKDPPANQAAADQHEEHHNEHGVGSTWSGMSGRILEAGAAGGFEEGEDCGKQEPSACGTRTVGNGSGGFHTRAVYPRCALSR